MVATQVRRLDGGSTGLDEEAIHGLRASMRGVLLQPEHEDYDDARKLWNAMIDRQPALMARCAGPRDVMAANAISTQERQNTHEVWSVLRMAESKYPGLEISF